MCSNTGDIEKKEGCTGLYLQQKNRNGPMGQGAEPRHVAVCTCKSVPKEVSLNGKYNWDGRNSLILPQTSPYFTEA